MTVDHDTLLPLSTGRNISCTANIKVESAASQQLKAKALTPLELKP